MAAKKRTTAKKTTTTTKRKTTAKAPRVGKAKISSWKAKGHAKPGPKPKN